MCRFRIGWWPLWLGLGGFLGADSSAPVPELRLRVRAFARETVRVENPVRSAVFLDRVAEGTRVQEGEVIFRIDMEGPEGRRVSAENRIEEAQVRERRQLGEIEDQTIALRDAREAKLDSKRVLEARLAWMRSLPRPEEVSLAEGRLEVALRNEAAAAEELRLARERRAKELLSPVALEEAELAHALQAARARHAGELVETARQPAHPDEVRVLELRMLNLDREIEKLGGEIDSKAELERIERAARKREMDSLEAERGEALEELGHAELRAPRTGVLLYSPAFKRALATGGQPGKGVVLAEIPLRESLALRGHMPEQFRTLFREGDPVRVRMNPDPERVLLGRVASLAPYSADALEGEGVQASGVKWVEVVLTLDESPSDLVFGAYGEAVLAASEPRPGPAVPLDWVRFREGKAHLSVDGLYQEVDGMAIGAQFVLEAPCPPLSSITPEGTWPANGHTMVATEEEMDRFTASGELMPVENVEVRVPRIRAWDIKFTWLHPENSWMEAGERIGELDSDTVRNRLRDAERGAKRGLEEREAAEEDLRLRRLDAAFRTEVAETELEILRLESRLVETAAGASARQQARLDVETTRLQAEAGRRELERARAHPDWIAPAELRRRERELFRRELTAEAAALRLTLAEQGPDAVRRSQARLAVLRGEAALADVRARVRRSVAWGESRLRGRRRNERWRAEQLRRAREEMDSLVLTAPVPGLLKYETIWDGVGQSKVRAGVGVWSGTRVLGVSDARRLKVVISVPERYVSRLREGMPVRLRVPSEGNRAWPGTISRLHVLLEPAEPSALRASPYANREPPHEQVLRVEVLVDDLPPGSSLKPGAIAHVVFPFAK